MRLLRFSLAASLAGLCLTLGATRASAQGGAVSGQGDEAMSMDEAWDALKDGETSLAGGDCVTMCKALHSMARAAQRICALAEGGGEADRQRCLDAKTRVEEATKRVLAACPGCNPSPPYAPATVPPPPTVGGSDGGGDSDKAAVSKTVADAPTMAGMSESLRSEARTPRLTIALVPTALFLPPAIFKLSVDMRIIDHLSLAFAGGFGRLATTGGDGHATVATLALQQRVYLFAPFSGLYLGAEVRSVWPSLEDGERLTTRAVVPGTTLGPTLGYKLIAFGGFTLDTSFGLGVVAVDRRREGQPSDAVVPVWDLGVGYSF